MNGPHVTELLISMSVSGSTRAVIATATTASVNAIVRSGLGNFLAMVPILVHQAGPMPRQYRSTAAL